MKKQTHRILAFYLFTTIKNPQEEVSLHKSFCEKRNIKGRIYISEEGINGQMSGTVQDAESYMEWLQCRDPFQSIEFKIDPYHEQAFEKLIIKYREQLVALDQKVDLSLTGTHLEPEAWKEMLEKEDKHLLIDVRNDYEWKVGKFENAETPACSTFREFRTYAQELKNRIDPSETPVMMYCTGGIRCEVYSALLKEYGFKNVYQLKGGIINYGKKVGAKHWLGKLFVFDDRMTTPISDQESTPVIGKCHRCQQPSESYYNCANMDCNHLFLSCDSCLKELSGCCKEECLQAPRVRPFYEQNPHKPFRKWYRYFRMKFTPRKVS
ncbi:MAG: rhodanese-related sulfurtransferase [Chlamydiales bacterium]